MGKIHVAIILLCILTFSCLVILFSKEEKKYQINNSKAMNQNSEITDEDQTDDSDEVLVVNRDISGKMEIEGILNQKRNQFSLDTSEYGEIILLVSDDKQNEVEKNVDSELKFKGLVIKKNDVLVMKVDSFIVLIDVNVQDVSDNEIFNNDANDPDNDTEDAEVPDTDDGSDN